MAEGEALRRGGGSFSGFAGSGAARMEAPPEYVLLSDQDDVWLPHKAERLLGQMRRTEREARGKWAGADASGAGSLRPDGDG